MELDFNVVTPENSPWRKEKERVFYIKTTALAGETVAVLPIRQDKDIDRDGRVDTVFAEVHTRVVDPETGETKYLNGALTTYHEQSKDIDIEHDDTIEDVIGQWFGVIIDEALQRAVRRYESQKSLNVF